RAGRPVAAGGIAWRRGGQRVLGAAHRFARGERGLPRDGGRRGVPRAGRTAAELRRRGAGRAGLRDLPGDQGDAARRQAHGRAPRWVSPAAAAGLRPAGARRLPRVGEGAREDRTLSRAPGYGGQSLSAGLAASGPTQAARTRRAASTTAGVSAPRSVTTGASSMRR